MNTVRMLQPRFSDRTVAFREEPTRPVDDPLGPSSAVESTGVTRVWFHSTPPEATGVTVVTRPARTRRTSIVTVCLVSLVLGALGGVVVREVVPSVGRWLERHSLRDARHSIVETPASLVTRSPGAKTEPAAAPAPSAAPAKMAKKARAAKPASATSDLEIETSFRTDS